MSRLRTARLAIAALVALGSPAAVASAGAAGWQGPATISDPAINTGDAATIALGRSGDAGALWWDEPGGGRIMGARKRAGAVSWTPPAIITSSASAPAIYAGEDGAANITAAYAAGTGTTLLTWPAAAVTPAITTLPLAFTVTDLAVDAAGDAVIAGQFGSPAGLTVGYRKGAGGTFAFRTYPYNTAPITMNVDTARVAINASGSAVVAFRSGTSLYATQRTAAGDWPAVPEQVSTTAGISGTPAVGIDDAGNVVAAFTHPTAAMSTVKAARRSAATGVWLESGELSSAAAGSAAASLDLAVNGSGVAALVWQQTTGAVTNVQARYGTTGSGFLGNAEDVNDAQAAQPVAAIGDDGSVVAAWSRQGMSGNIDQARVRSTGTTGTWGDTRTLDPPHPNGTVPSLATDGRGDFATVTEPYDGTAKHVTLSFYDSAAPVLTPPTLTGGPFAGIPVTLATTASDAWSAVGTPVWTFGDGGTGSGLSVNHTYAAGTYTAHVSVTDALGNTGGADVAVVVQAAAVTIDTARFSAKWRRSRVGGTLTVAGTAPIAGSYALDVARGKARRIHVTLKLAPGAYSRAVRLPATLLPGSYTLTLTPAAKGVTGAAFALALAPPSEGVVDVVALSRARGGRSIHSLHDARTLWARFHFAAVPKPAAKLKVTWFRTYRGKRTTLAHVLRKPAATISSSLALRGRRGTITGTITAVITRGGKIIAQSAARVT